MITSARKLIKVFFLYSLLHWACDREMMSVVSELLNKGADISLKDEDDLTPLDYACICENEDLISLLVRLEGTVLFRWIMVQSYLIVSQVL